MPQEFDPSRLTLARRLAGLTKRDLAQRVGVSAPAITQFEAGKIVPRGAVQARLSLVLGCHPDYFKRSVGRRSPRTDARSFFRSLRSTRQGERDYAEALVEHIADVVGLVEEEYDLPPLDLPDCSWVQEQAGIADFEKVASTVREEWNLPQGPVGHVVRELEAHGVLVARLGQESLRIDAFSRWIDDRPLVVLWASKGDKARSRFDASHELGHLLMHPEPEPANPLFESQAQSFASAFLMPAEDIIDELPRRPPRHGDWDSLFETRRRWGVSIAALFRRARDLAVLSEAGYRRAMMGLSARGMRRGEGDDLGAPEQPEFIARAVAAVAQDRGLTLDQLANDLRFSVSHIEALLGPDPHASVEGRGQRALRAV